MLLLLGHPELESKGTAENERLLPPGAHITSGRTTRAYRRREFPREARSGSQSAAALADVIKTGSQRVGANRD